MTGVQPQFTTTRQHDQVHLRDISSGSRTGTAAGRSLQRSSTTQQNRTHVQENSNQMGEARGVYKGFYVRDVTRPSQTLCTFPLGPRGIT